MLLHNAVFFLHVIVAGLLVLLVLIQRGKGAEAGAAFGAGASGTVFGAKGSSNFLSHSTAVLAAVFFITSLALAYFSSQTIEPDSVIDVSAPSEETIVLPTEGGPTDDGFIDEGIGTLDIGTDDVPDLPAVEEADETVVIDEEAEEN